MDGSLLTALLAAQQVLVLQRQSEGAFVLVGQPPTWLEPWLALNHPMAEPVRPVEWFPYLEVFLPQAERIWQSLPPGQLRSGIWTETDREGRELQLDASALCLAQGSVLLLRRLDAEYSERQRILQQARERALDHERLLKEIGKKEILLHCIVHDLAGPLSGMQGCLEILGQENLSSEARSYLHIGLAQARKQANLIKDLLDIYAAEVGALEPVAADPAQLPDLIGCAEEVANGLSAAFSGKGVTTQLILSPSSPRPWPVVGEKSKLERVFYNLLENALRYSPSGSCVQIQLRQESPWIYVAIEDEGPGIAPDIAPQLFQKFFKGTGVAGKAGLGLFYCRITMDQWGGSVGCERRAEGGSRFWFRIRMPGRS
jgi:signal transduction histidine kinase